MIERVPEPAVVTDRIQLVPTSAHDRDEWLEAVHASRHLLHPWIDAADTTERFDELLVRAEQPEFHPFVVRVRDDGRLAGAINVSNIVRGPFQSAFTGFWAFVGSEGRGYMTHGLRAAIRHAFNALNLHRLEANIQPDNLPSIALAERCGFRYEGFSPNYLQVFGEWRDHNRYAVIPEIWDSGHEP